MQPSNDENDNHPNSALIDKFTKNILSEQNSSYWEYTYHIPFFNKLDGIKNVRACIELSKELIKPDFNSNFYHVNVFLKIKKYNPNVNMMLSPGEEEEDRFLLSENICIVQFDDHFENLPPRFITESILRNNTIGGLYNNMMIILTTANTLLSNLKFDKYEVLFYSKLKNFPNEKRFWCKCKQDIHMCCVCDDDCGSYIASCNHYICLVCASSLVRETCPLCRSQINKILFE